MTKNRLALLLSATMAFSMFANVAIGAEKAPQKEKTEQEAYIHLREKGVVHNSNNNSNLGENLTRRQAAAFVANFAEKFNPGFRESFEKNKKEIEEAQLANKPIKVSYTDKRYDYKNCKEIAAIEALTNPSYRFVQGKGNRVFGINDNVTLEELVQMMVNVITHLKLEGVSLPAVAQNNAANWAKSSWQFGLDYGLISRNDRPSAVGKRGQVAIIVDKCYSFVEAKKSETETPKVTDYKVIDPKTVEFKMSDQGVQKVTLEQALEANKEREVTFTYTNKQNKQYKITHKVTYKVATAQGIESVKADNFKEITIKFDGEVDSKTAENIDNYSLSSYSSVSNLNFSEATLSDDGKKVTLLIKQDSGKLINQKEMELNISGVQSRDGSRTFNEKRKFTPVDVSLPEVKEVKALGTAAFKVEFSEPVTEGTAGNAANYQVNGHIISGDAKYIYPNKVIVVTSLSAGEHTLDVKRIEDFAGHRIMIPNSKKFTAVRDTEAPKIKSAKTKDFRTVELEFDETVKEIENVSHSYGTQTTEKIEYKGNKVIVTFKEANRLSHGENTIYVRGVKDYSGNKADRDVKITPELNTTRPYVKSIEVKVENGDTQFIFDFSKPVRESDIMNPENYVLKKGSEVVTSYGFNSNGHPFTKPRYLERNGRKIDNKVIMTARGILPKDTYRLKVSHITDKEPLGNVMYPQDLTIDVTTTGAVAPISGWYISDGDDYKIHVQFNTEVAASGTGKAADPSKYQLVVDGIYKSFPLQYTTAELRDSKTVVITVPKEHARYLEVPKVNQIRVTGVADRQGNNYMNDTKTVSFGSSNTVTVNLIEGSMRVIANNKAVFELNGELTHLNRNDFEFYPSRDFNLESKIENGKTIVTVVFLDAAFNSSGTNITMRTRPQSEISSETRHGHRMRAFTDYKSFKDGIRPMATGATVKRNSDGSKYIEIRFNENIKSYLNPGTKLEIRHGSDILNIDRVEVIDGNDKVAAANTAGAKIWIRLKTWQNIPSGGYVGVQLRDNAYSRAIVDENNNAVEDFSILASRDDQ